MLSFARDLPHQSSKLCRRVHRHNNTVPGSVPLDPGNASDMDALSDARHYLDYATGVYGWKLYLFEHRCCCCCRVLPKCEATLCCDGPCGRHPAVTADTCGCNETVLRLSGIHSRDDLRYASYVNQVRS